MQEEPTKALGAAHRETKLHDGIPFPGQLFKSGLEDGFTTTVASSKLPSYEAPRGSSQRARPSLDFFRLRWSLSGPMSTQIKVLSVVDANSLPTPYQTDSTLFHPISGSPVSDPPVSSITVTADVLNGWAADWEDAHHKHTHGCGAFASQPDGTERLMRCCGKDRPGPGPALTVAASSEPFVTIHDFVMAVHPWLLALEPDIRAAYGVFHSVPLPLEFDILVRPVGLSPLFLLNTKYAHPAALEAEQRRVAGVVAKRITEEEEEEGLKRRAMGYITACVPSLTYFS